MAKEKQYVVEHFSDYISPKTADEFGKKWVLWGSNNKFYDHLRNLFLNSTTNNSVINGIVQLTWGSGIELSDKNQFLLAQKMKVNDLKKALKSLYTYNKVAFQVEYKMNGNKRDSEGGIESVFFVPANYIGMEKKDDEGDVNNYYYSENWKKKDTEKYRPICLPAYGMGEDTDPVEIYFYQDQDEDEDYYAPVCYHGCLQYAECEVELSNYHLNHILNGFTTNAIVNFNNGIPTPDQRREIVRDFKQTKTGSENAGKPFITFNDGVERAVTVESYDIPDPHRQYEFIDSLSREKVLLGHKVTSPLLLGVRETSGGLGSNSEEIKESYNLFKEMVLDSLRQSYKECLIPLMLAFGIKESPKLDDLDIFKDEKPAAPEAPKSVEQSESIKRLDETTEKQILSALDQSGEYIDGEYWDEISCVPVDTTSEQEQKFQENYKSVMMETLPSDGSPQDRSAEGDSGLFKIRYRYGPAQLKDNSREFCKFMVGRVRDGVVYRKEEIDGWQQQGVNASLAAKGESNYSIWEWKGGAYCHHRWYRVVFFRKRNADGSFKTRSEDSGMSNDERLTVGEARSKGVPNSVITPKDWATASTKPIDTPNRGKLN